MDQQGYDPTENIIQALLQRQQGMAAQPTGGGMAVPAMGMASQLGTAYMMRNMQNRQKPGLVGGGNSYAGPFSATADAQPANTYTGNMY
jgi:hypothetical protein